MMFLAALLLVRRRLGLVLEKLFLLEFATANLAIEIEKVALVLRRRVLQHFQHRRHDVPLLRFNTRFRLLPTKHCQ